MVLHVHVVCPLPVDSEEGNQQISFETLGATSQGTCRSGIFEEVIFEPLWFPRPSVFFSTIDEALAFQCSRRGRERVERT